MKFKQQELETENRYQTDDIYIYFFFFGHSPGGMGEA